MEVFTGGYTLPARNAGSVHLQSRRDDRACGYARLRPAANVGRSEDVSAIANAEREAQEKIQLQQVVRGLRFPPEYVNFCSERLIGRQPAMSGNSAL